MEEGGDHVGHPHSTAARPVEQHLAVLHRSALGLQPIDDPVHNQQHYSKLTRHSREGQPRKTSLSGI